MAFEKNGLHGESKGRKSLKVFQFDNCIGETRGHSLQIGIDQSVSWITDFRAGIQQEEEVKNFVLLFG